MPRCRTDESGQSTVLILGLTTIVLMLSAVILGATAVNTAGRQLLAEADGASSAAAHTVQTGPIQAGGANSGLPGASAAQVEQAAENHLRETGAYDRHQNLAVTGAWVSSTGDTVHVDLAATAELPVIGWVLPAHVDVAAESHARITINR